MTPASPPSSSGRSAAISPSACDVAPADAATEADSLDPVLCTHCGRTARNGLTCQGICVADSGY
ncbi:MAG: hypothetical protein VKO26_06390 [Cyanobacteriota bacterium]|nr:hypothetical protein [Cyanobacteria bacterium K_Offshore_surface_m2_239]MEB3157046.1 hypothetical protein [Cyanobacteriota bacterium]